MNNNNNIVLMIVALLFGVNFTLLINDKENSNKTPKAPIKAPKDLSSELKKVSEEFNKIESKEDKLLIYKLLAGSAEYLNAVKSLNNTGQFDPVLGRVQSSYGWNRDKYSDFTDAVSKYLVSEKYDEPKELSSREDRAKFADIFTRLAEALQ